MSAHRLHKPALSHYQKKQRLHSGRFYLSPSLTDELLMLNDEWGMSEGDVIEYISEHGEWME